MSFKETYTWHWQGIKWSSLIIHLFLLAMYCSVYAQEKKEENSGTSSRFPSSISESYSQASVAGTQYTGGLIGKTNGNIQILNAYSTGLVQGEDIKVGGLIGGIEGNGMATACYWDTLTSGLSLSAAGSGRSKTKMVYPNASDTYVGWDFQSTWKKDVTNINAGYPYLDPKLPTMYQISTLTEPVGAGVVSGSGAFASGTKVKVNAKPNNGYQFSNWTAQDGGILSENQNYAATMASNSMVLTAHFKLVSAVSDWTNNFLIYPNPFHNSIHIRNTDLIGEVLLSNQQGQTMLKMSINGDTTIDTDRFQQGIYILTLITHDGRYTSKTLIKY